jgi:tRNA A22 N-methylase
MGSYLIIVLEDQPQRVIFGEIVPGPVDEDHQLVADTKKALRITRGAFLNV